MSLRDILWWIWSNIIEAIWVSKKSLTNKLSVYIKSNKGDTVSIDLDPKWQIKELKEAIAPKLGFPAEEVEIILAGKLLEDSTVIEDCDLGERSILHAVRGHGSELKSRPLNQTLYDLIEERTDDVPQSTAKPHFYVYCSICVTTDPSRPSYREGKLRVRCSSCKSGAIAVDVDPQSWSDVLEPHKISGHCVEDGCLDGVVAWAEFYFKCAEHKPKNSLETEAVSLFLIRPNTRNVPCLACTDTLDPVLVFPCSHTTCLDCFSTYIISRLRERRFKLDEKIGYTLPCPVGCQDSLISEIHHFRLLPPELYLMYQRFATEDCILQNGGVLCPQPNCGQGVIPDDDCTTVKCPACSFVYCKKCLQGNHLGDCDDVEPVSKDDNYSVDPARAAQARWEQASRLTIKSGTKPCPKCRTATERAGGCMHMVCTRCCLEWCWVCQKEWTRDCMGSHWFG